MPPADDSAERPNDLDGLGLQLSGHPALAGLFTDADPNAAATDVSDLETKVEEAWLALGGSPLRSAKARLGDEKLVTDVRPFLAA